MWNFSLRGLFLINQTFKLSVPKNFMKNVIFILFLVGITLAVSGCVQETVQKENFTEYHFSFNSLDYAVGLDTDLWPTKEAWARDICQMCHVGMVVHPVLGEQKCPGYPDATCNCPVSLRAKFDIGVPVGWDRISCKFKLNDKLLETKIYNETGSIDYVIDSSFGPRIDENQTLEICCEHICNTKTLVSVC